MVRLTKKEKLDKMELLSSINEVNVEASKQSDNAAYEYTSDCYEPDVDERDLVFLEGILHNLTTSPQRRICDRDSYTNGFTQISAVQLNNVRLVNEIVRDCRHSRNKDSRELGKLLSSHHLEALIKVHDEIGANLSPTSTSSSSVSSPANREIKKELVTPIQYLNSTMPGQMIKMVSLRKNPHEPLGLTVEVDEFNQLVVARIIAGGMIDKQGLLNPGDVILEVNGVPVKSPEELQTEVSMAKDALTLKIGPNVDEEIKSAKLSMSAPGKSGKNLEPGKKLTCYMRALFDYDPSTDTLLPCKEIGLPFKHGDILQIINVKDPNWWQAKHVNDTSDKTGLIPSHELEERRKAFVPPEADYVHKISICGTRISKKKRKTMYKSIANAEFDKADLMPYEEVTRMPPFKRRTLILIGVSGVGRRTLKTRLINSNPDKFGAAIPHTSRLPRPLEENGKGYLFVSREFMEDEIQLNNFLEFGEHNGNLYGTHLDTVRDVIKSGKMCVIDCSANVLKLLRNSSELMPYVIFIAPAGMEQLKVIYAERRAMGGSSKNLATFDRQSSIRYSSRRARTLESLASLYEEDDLVSLVEESAILQRKYEKYLDMVIVNEDFDETFRKVSEALEDLSHTEQFVPVNWIY